MKFINQYSFIIVAVVALVVLGVFILRGGLKLQNLLALGALILGIVLAYRFLNPGSGSSDQSERILAEIQSDSSVLLEFQSPY
jgi:membrane protein implicated in regulation of membrane protease activity